MFKSKGGLKLEASSDLFSGLVTTIIKLNDKFAAVDGVTSNQFQVVNLEDLQMKKVIEHEFKFLKSGILAFDTCFLGFVNGIAEFDVKELKLSRQL